MSQVGDDRSVTVAAALPQEAHASGSQGRLNRLRAAVLGANDGIASVAGIVVGVAGATTSRSAILIAGVAGWVAGAVSMSLGEYVSVSAQRDSEEAMLAQERRELAEDPEGELDELTAIYRAKGLSEQTARAVATELTAHDALGAHAEAELSIDTDDLVSAPQAAAASAVSFTIGAGLPLAAMALLPGVLRVPLTVVVVLAALAGFGAASARISNASVRRAALRMLVGGALGLAVTYAIGLLVGRIGG